MILKLESTKNPQAIMFLEKLGIMNWVHFVFHFHIENLKDLLVKNQFSDFKLIWQQLYLSRPLLNKECWFIENISHLSSGEHSGPLASCLKI